MWNSLLGNAEKTKERIAQALEKTSDVLNEKANELKKANMKEEGSENIEEEKSEEKGKDGDSKSSTSTSSYILIEEQEPISISKSKEPTKEKKIEEDKMANLVKQSDEIFGKMQLGWGNVLKATRKHVEEVQKQIPGNISSLFQMTPSGHRSLSLALDVAALRDAEVVYVTDRLITMGHPNMQSSTDADITPERKLAAIGHLLKKRHMGRFMVWDLSEVEYDYSILDDEVLPFHFPGSPSPPLGMLLKLLLSVESWLKADPRNVAVFHCLTGKGRTSTVVACFLCWIGEAGFHDPMKALEYIAVCKRCPPQSLTIPSQRRYASYFSNMLDGVRPHQPPLVLKRIIMSEAPKYSKPISNNTDLKTEEEKSKKDIQNEWGCAPYLQIFKAGRLIFTTTPTIPDRHQGKDDLPFCVQSDGPISFPIDIVIQGDVLLRCRHMTSKGQRLSMFRAAFHTGYIATTKVLRLTKGQLDGACSDKRFGEDFFIDLIFEACESSLASKHLVSSMKKSSSTDDIDSYNSTEAKMSKKDDNPSKKSEKNVSSNKSNASLNEAQERRMRGAMSNSFSTKNNSEQIASTYDSMLHRDSHFWDVIAARRNEHFSNVQCNSSQFLDGSGALSGPIIGRRRDFSKATNNDKNSDDNEKDATVDGNQTPSSIDTFSIGDTFGIMGDDNIHFGDSFVEKDKNVKTKTKVRKKDSLMEALMAIDDDIPNSNLNDDQGDVAHLSDDTGKAKQLPTTESDSEQVTNQISTDHNPTEKQEETQTGNQSNEDVDQMQEDLPTESGVHYEVNEYDDDDDDDDEELEDLENFLTKKK